MEDFFKEHYSPAEFSVLTGLSMATVRRYLANGRLPKVQFGGRRCRVLIPGSALRAATETEREHSSKNPTYGETPPSEALLPTLTPARRGPIPRWKR